MYAVLMKNKIFAISQWQTYRNSMHRKIPKFQKLYLQTHHMYKLHTIELARRSDLVCFIRPWKGTDLQTHHHRCPPAPPRGFAVRRTCGHALYRHAKKYSYKLPSSGFRLLWILCSKTAEPFHLSGGSDWCVTWQTLKCSPEDLLVNWALAVMTWIHNKHQSFLNCHTVQPVMYEGIVCTFSKKFNKSASFKKRQNSCFQ